MLTQIVLTIIIVFILGLAYAITSLKLGRGDKRPGCGHGTCSTCNPDNPNATCPTENAQSDLFANIIPNPAEDENYSVYDPDADTDVGAEPRS